MARGVPQATGIVVDHARGAVLTDVDGREFIDLAGGIGVMNVGHCDPRVVAAVAAQVARLQHVCIHIATHEPYVALCERLVELLPHGDHTKAMLVNSGAEAVENAVKIARQATGRPAIICFTGAFHGRTLMGMTLTSKVAYKAGCGPFAPEIYRLPFPDALRGGGYDHPEAFAARALSEFEEALETYVSATNVAAILVEPVQGEGGFVPLPPLYLRGLRELCDRNGMLLILDEVQTGFGRCGAWGAYQHYGVTPDLSAWAKSLGGGLPIGAVMGRAAVMDAALPGTIGGTFGGNPVACASALATLDVMEADGLCARAQTIGAHVRARFEALRGRVPQVVDVRGLGAMMALELCVDGDLKRPAGALTKAVLAGCHAAGVLVIGAGVHGSVIRVLSPLVITEAQLDRALDIIEEQIVSHTQ